MSNITKILKKGILLTAYGAGGAEGQRSLRLFDDAVRKNFPGVPIRWAFSSELMRGRLTAERIKTDSVHKALCRLSFERFTHIAVQSLHVIPGLEYEDLQDDIKKIMHDKVLACATLGAPLLNGMQNPASVELTAGALIKHIPESRMPTEAVLCVGHGTKHSEKCNYALLEKSLSGQDINIFTSTLEDKKNIENILHKLREKSCNTTWVMPLFSVLGKHSYEDIAGSKKSSWISTLTGAGINCHPVMRGLAEYENFVEIWIENLKIAVMDLDVHT